eukprot:223418_1
MRSSSTSQDVGLIVGDRVVVLPSKQSVSERIGTVRFVGNIQENDNLYFGIELDRSTGKHDGVFRGRRYFRTGARRGVFVRASRIKGVLDWEGNGHADFETEDTRSELRRMKKKKHLNVRKPSIRHSDRLMKKSTRTLGSRHRKSGRTSRALRLLALLLYTDRTLSTAILANPRKQRTIIFEIV